MKNSQLPDFTIIRCDDKAALVDPESKVCLIVSKRIADTLNLKETNDKIYPIWSKQAEFQRKIDAKREKINTLYLMVTRQCNMNCDFCAINANQNMKINKEFTLESVNERIIPFLSYISPHKVVITGGEPFVKKDIVDIVGNIRKKVKCPIILQSNGLAVDETKLEFLSSQINEINFSTKHMFESPNRIIKLRKNIEYCIKTGIKVVLSFIYDRQNKEDLFRLLDIAAEYDVEVLLNFVAPVGRGKNREDILTESDKLEMNLEILEYIYAHGYEEKKLFNMTESILQVKKSCGGYGKVMAIFPEGNIYMCQCLENENFRIGNIQVDTSETIGQTLLEMLEKDEIKTAFCVDNKTVCQKCEYRYLCAGKCPVSSKVNDNNCYLLKRLIDYQLFYKRESDSKKEKLNEYIKFLKSLKVDIKD